MKHTEVHDSILLSPYRGVQRLIHMLLLNTANDDASAWPSVEWLAQHAGCSRRYVLQTLAKMRLDGIIEKVGSTASGVVKYRISLPSRGEPQFTTPLNQGSPQGGTTVHPETKRNTGEPHVSRLAARQGGTDVVMVGGLPGEGEPEEETAADLGARPTFKTCEALFRRRARQIGQVNYPIGVVRRTIKVLREEKGLDYRGIADVIETFFVRYEADARNADNVATLFRYQANAVLNFARKQRDVRDEEADDQSWKSDTARKRDEQMAQIAAHMKEKYGW